jgi:hypothetical protein
MPLHRSRVPRGCSGGCYEPTCQVLLFPYIVHTVVSHHIFSRQTSDGNLNKILTFVGEDPEINAYTYRHTAI